MVEETISSGAGGRMPWESVRDWFHAAGNYVDPLDRAAEALAAAIGPGDAAMTAGLARHGIAIETAPGDPAPIRAFDRARGLLTLGGALPPESRRFLIAHQLAAIEFDTAIETIVAGAPLASDAARNLLRIGLANYAAGALMMPYAAFRSAARTARHDIDRLCRSFGVSFEQACHRLSTLQRPGAEGIPFYFCRVDMAGNITKRHSATRFQFARFGGACPLWIVHEAAAIPDRIVVQHAETPDGVRYVSMAKGLVKPSGSFTRTPAAMPSRLAAKRSMPPISSMPMRSTAARRRRRSAFRAGYARATIAINAPFHRRTAASRSTRICAAPCHTGWSDSSPARGRS